ncbi:MAG: hypothetical protein FJ266_10020 [Planctomycetes bacterium]|nr:hypothetical protein [Planctomycetota bacterium]
MSKVNKVFACIQIIIFLILPLCGSGITFNVSGKSDGFPCKDHACGCKSEADCKAHCCCSPNGNQLMTQDGDQKEKSSLQSFISSIKCKSGSDAITVLNAEGKYLPVDNLSIPKITFLCFLTGNPLVRLSEPMVFPPEKPPRCFA